MPLSPGRNQDDKKKSLTAKSGWKMKTRYVKILGLPYYSKEHKRFPWSRWEPVRNAIGQIIPFRHLPDGTFDAEWK